MRIVSAPSNTEILYALGCADEIMAVTRFCDYPEEAKLKPKVGGWLDVDEELITIKVANKVRVNDCVIEI
ncbi:MAG: hypothetical protein AABX39_01955 [Nanoarchaeota archaeon]